MVDFALIRDPRTGAWRGYREPVEVVTVHRVDGVMDAIHRIETAVETRGLGAAGFIAYEAAPAFDAALRVRERDPRVPLLQFGLFESFSNGDRLDTGRVPDHRVGEWTASEDQDAHRESVRQIRERIACGDTYQVNHSMRLRASFDGDPLGLFHTLVRSQPDAFAAYLDCGDLAICSASPELFFSLDGNKIVSRPMKGTAGRGHDLASDRRQQQWLQTSEKNRAENAMIVDMVRNDLGRIARVGTVGVTSRFDVERHPTVFQMTSTVAAETTAPVSEILAALFPFASVTGAPKVRTMGLISELEPDPRGVYTGAIGVIEPGRRARFSVAIRTAVVDRTAGVVEYGVGSGIVWDSSAGDEYSECRAKAGILSAPRPDFELLETILWEPGQGFALLDRHLDRLAGAAEYFGRRFDRRRILEGLQAVPHLAPPRSLRVRLLVAADGTHRIEVTPIEAEKDPGPVRLGLAGSPAKTNDPFLHFKTTHREVYDTARRSRSDCDDVLLWNERGEVTESTIANLVARIDGRLVTPPTACGLLDGTFRAELLERGEIKERVIKVSEVADAEAIYLVNSVQGWRDADWVSRAASGTAESPPS